MRQHARAAALLAVALQLACATMRSGPPTVGLRIEGSAPDATVWIDDRLAGRLVDFTKADQRLRTGFHRIEVRAAGYYSSFREVDAKPGQNVVIRADLHELVD